MGRLRVWLLPLLLLGCACHPADLVRPAEAPAAQVSAATAARTARSSDGVPIRYEVRGQGAPALVFVHGWSCDRSYWTHQLDHFASRYRVVALDLAGHGESGNGRAAWNASSFARDVQAVLDDLGIESAVLIGHSMGGDVILEAAALMPGRVRAVIGIDTYQDADFKVAPEQLDTWLSAMRADFAGSAGEIIRKYFFRPGADPALVDRIVAEMTSAPPDIAIPAFRSALTYDLARGLSAARVPVRAINSDLSPTQVEAARRHAPDFQVTIVPGVGHFLMLEAPEAFERALDETLRDLAL